MRPRACHLAALFPLPHLTFLVSSFLSRLAAKARRKAWATLQRVRTMAEVHALPASRMLLVSPGLFHNITAEYLAPAPSPSGRAFDWRRNVRGILVEVGDHGNVSAADLAMPASNPGVATRYFPFSPGERYPQAKLRPLDDPGNHTWNPFGTGAVAARFDDFPIAFLDSAGTDLARTFAADNVRRRYVKPNRVASADLTMAADGMTSKQCLVERACLPVGGYSVLASVPPQLAGTGPGAGGESVVLVASRLDAASLFHDLAAGANAAMSGLIVMLAAAEAYNSALLRYQKGVADATPAMPKPIVFAAFAAEDWGYAGSRRFAYEMAASATEAKSDFLPGLAGRVVDAVVEIGMIGLAKRRVSGDAAAPVYVHANAAGGDASDAIVAALIAGVTAGGGDGKSDPAAQIAMTKAKAAPPAPGSSDGRLTPPSSLHSFTRRRRDTPGVVVAEYDGAFVDPFHGSVFDKGTEAVDAIRMAKVSAATARALATLAFAGNKDASAAVAGEVSEASVLSTVAELVRCLIDPAVGFDCLLARRLFAAEEVFPTRYTGVLPGIMDDWQHPLGKTDVQRFVWNFLANATAAADSSRKSCGLHAGECDADRGEVCMGATGTGMDGDVEDMSGTGSQVDQGKSERRRGRRSLQGSGGGVVDDNGGGRKPGACVRASPRFLPALSHRLSFDRKKAQWSVAEPSELEAALPGGLDPIWAESNWPAGIGVIMYHHEGTAREWAMLAFGLVITAGSYVLVRRFNHQVKERFKEE